MENNRKSYRLRTGIGNEAPSSLEINLNQTFETLDVLSLEINQKNFYKMPTSGYGVIVGRVIANGGFGVPNAKVSVFIPYESGNLVENENTLYNYTSTMSKDSDGIRYNLFPNHLDNECHQDIGTMWSKEYMLDNNDIINVFDKYYKYTAVTNNGGDYFIYGVPIGTQTVHVDIDLSDIGVLSQRPRDMMYKGYNAELFENPNKFKKDKNLNILSQVYSQDKVVNVFPFWGDTSVNPTVGTITRCDIDIDYKFEPTCVFIGSIVSDTAERAISQRCVPDDEIGKMSELITGEGRIEMIRRTFDGKVEEFSIKGNNLIDGDGVWCYQIPMNLDYVMTNEFGEMVPTDDPNKGIPTRTRVRFRISMNETETDGTARKRARFLVPNNPKLSDDYPAFSKSHEADYEFGTFTKEESYRDLFWNKVYTVKSYIPRLQKAKAMRRRVHTGIKNVNHPGDNNPFPFNNLFIRLTFLYRFICTLMTIFCVTIYAINTVLGLIGVGLYHLAKAMFDLGDASIVPCGMAEWLYDTGNTLLRTVENITIKLDNFCDDGNFDNPSYIPIGSISQILSYPSLFLNPNNYINRDLQSNNCREKRAVFPKQEINISFDLSRLFNCIENQLAQDQECTSFNFNNDWVNGVLYAPLWYRKVRSKKKIFFGLFTRKARDKWCDGSSNKMSKGLSLCQTCAQKRTLNQSRSEIMPIPKAKINLLQPITLTKEETCYGYKCHKKNISFINLNKGLIITKQTMLGENVYYYKSVEYDNENLYKQGDTKVKGDFKRLFATDIVLLGSLNECDSEGVPQFFKNLEGTTYNMPPDLAIMDYNSDMEEKLKYEGKTEDKSSSDAKAEMSIGDDGLENVPDEIDESEAISNISDIYTDKTGADWGNFGRDQSDEDYLRNYYGFGINTSTNTFLFSTKITKNPPMAEDPDLGGLFYGLTCWSAYTKPKSCINLSRICEYGVSLDESQEFPVYSEPDPGQEDGFKYEVLSPDGFVSYDELYDMDGRAMFATMNGNNLRTKVNPENGFPIYDFMYLYPENFDGSMHELMLQFPLIDGMGSPQNMNYGLENSSEAYVRFRYGYNKDDGENGRPPIVKFYNSDKKIGLYSGNYKINSDRFPKYENSFYFYFGLKAGNTAIDKFRTKFYSDCYDTDGEHPTVSVDFKPNSWCSEVDINGEPSDKQVDGWLSIDATYVDAPYTVRLENLDGDTEFDLYSDINNPFTEPKVFFASDNENEDFDSGDYVWKELYSTPTPSDDELAKNIMNGRYRLTITDANGGEYTQVIEYYKPYIRATISQSPFRVENKMLREMFPGDYCQAAATLGGAEGQNMSDRSPIGGFVKVTDVSQEGSVAVSFRVEVEPQFSFIEPPTVSSGTTEMLQQQSYRYIVTSYSGSKMDMYYESINPLYPDDSIVRYDGTTMYEYRGEGYAYCPYTYDYPQYGTQEQTNGGRYDFRFGVPLGGKKYRVTVTMLCRKKISENNFVYVPTRNQVSSIINVQEPIKFKMFLNGIDYELIKNFETGWDVGLNFPRSYAVLTGDINANVHGWLNMEDIDGLKEIEQVPQIGSDDVQYNYENYIKASDLLLSNSPEAHPIDDENPQGNPDLNVGYYNWTEPYTFNPENAVTDIQSFSYVPIEQQSGEKLIRVKYSPREYEDNMVYYRYDCVLFGGNQYVCIVDETEAGAFDAHSWSQISLTYGRYYYWIWDDNTGKYRPYGGISPSIQTISMQEYYDNGDAEIKNNIIVALNSYIVARKTVALQVKNAFTMQEDTPFNLTVTYATNEVPVKTLMYHSPDYENSTSFETELLSESYDENTDYNIVEPTLKGLLVDENGVLLCDSNPCKLENLGVLFFNPIGYDNGAFVYKKPWLVAIQNALKEKIPVMPDTIDDITTASEADIAPYLFGIHVYDDNVSLAYNAWPYIDNWPYYYNWKLYGGNTSLQQWDPHYISFDGLFAGFMLNGTPERYGEDYETYFEQQSIGEEPIHIKTVSIDSFGNIKTERKPVVRLFYSEVQDVGEDGVYTDYEISNLVTHGSDINVEGDIQTVNAVAVGYQHLLIKSVDTSLSINGKVLLTFDDEVIPSTVDYATGINIDFYYILMQFPEGYYTYYDNEPNPIYEKGEGRDYNHTTISFPSYQGNTPTMSFFDSNFNFTENNTLHAIKSFYTESKTMFAVRVSKDLQRRCVSKTFDVTMVEYLINLRTSSSGSRVCISINLGLYFDTAGKQDVYLYLKNYTFSIEVVSSDGETIRFLTVDDGYQAHSNLVSQSIDNRHYCLTLELSDNEEFLEILRECDVFLTDITGFRRKIVKVSTSNEFHDFTT